MYPKAVRFSLAGAAAVAVVFLGGPVLQAVNISVPPPPGTIMRLSPGVTGTTVTTFGKPAMPGVQRITWAKFEFQPGAKHNFALPAKRGELCSIASGQTSITFQGQQTVLYRAGDAILAPLGAKGTESNSGGSKSVEFCWLIDFK